MTLQQPLSVGTWNVRWDNPGDGEHLWELRRTRLAALLREWSPDVLGLQEPYRHQLDYLLRALPDYESVGVGRDDGANAGEFCAILYRRDRFRAGGGGTFWLSEEPGAPGSRAWGARHPRICTWVTLIEHSTGAMFSLYNVHLDHEAQTAREKGVELFLERIAQSGPVLVLGDFNATPDNPAVIRVSEATSPALKSVFGEAPEGTFHGFTGEAPDGPIDHVFYSSEWQVLSARVLRGDGARPFPSDHFPVSAVLQLL